MSRNNAIHCTHLSKLDDTFLFRNNHTSSNEGPRICMKDRLIVSLGFIYILKLINFSDEKCYSYNWLFRYTKPILTLWTSLVSRIYQIIYLAYTKGV